MSRATFNTSDLGDRVSSNYRFNNYSRFSRRLSHPSLSRRFLFISVTSIILLLIDWQLITMLFSHLRYLKFNGRLIMLNACLVLSSTASSSIVLSIKSPPATKEVVYA